MKLLYKEFALAAHPSLFIFTFLRMPGDRSGLSIFSDFYVWLSCAIYYVYVRKRE